MTQRQQIEALLQQVPDEAMPQVITFLKLVTQRPKLISTKPPRGKDEPTTVASQSFGLIPVEVAILKQVLAEDVYDLE